jgi:general stress protein 26
MIHQVRRALGRNSYCTLATASRDGRPHAVGVLYAFARDRVYIITERNSKKVRDIEANPQVALCVPVRKYPLAPPFSIQFHGSASILDRDDAEIAELLGEGALRKIVGFGVLERPGMCFLKVTPVGKIHTWGIGLSAWQLLRNPVGADRSVELRQAETPPDAR